MPNAPQTHRPHGTGQRVQEHQYRGSSRERGYDSDWEKVRKQFAAENPICVMCEREGRTALVEEVDHIIPVKVRPDLRLDPSNLQSLCKSCHQKKTNQDKEIHGGLG